MGELNTGRLAVSGDDGHGELGPGGLGELGGGGQEELDLGAAMEGARPRRPGERRRRGRATAAAAARTSGGADERRQRRRRGQAAAKLSFPRNSCAEPFLPAKRLRQIFLSRRETGWRTLIWVLSGVRRKIGHLFAYSVGGRFFYPKYCA